MHEGIGYDKRPAPKGPEEALRIEISVDERAQESDRGYHEALRAKEARLEEVVQLDDLAQNAAAKAEKWAARASGDPELQRRIDELAQAYALLEKEVGETVARKTTGPEGERALAEAARRYAAISPDDPKGAGLLGQVIRFERLAGRSDAPPGLAERLCALANAALTETDRARRMRTEAELVDLLRAPAAVAADKRIRQNAADLAR